MIQRVEDLGNSLFVRLLFASETGAVDAVVHWLIDGVYGRVDVIAQIFRKEIGVRSGELAELGIEHADDFARLVVHDRLRHFVPQNGRTNASCIVGGGLRVDFAQVVSAVDSIWDDTGLFVESPAVLAHEGPDRGESYNVFQCLQGAYDGGTVGPGASPGYVQVIASGLRREAAASVRCDPIPKTRRRSHEPSVRVLPLPLGLPLAVYEHSRHSASLRSS